MDFHNGVIYWLDRGMTLASLGVKATDEYEKLEKAIDKVSKNFSVELDNDTVTLNHADKWGSFDLQLLGNISKEQAISYIQRRDFNNLVTSDNDWGVLGDVDDKLSEIVYFAVKRITREAFDSNADIPKRIDSPYPIVV